MEEKNIGIAALVWEWTCTARSKLDEGFADFMSWAPKPTARLFPSKTHLTFIAIQIRSREQCLVLSSLE